MQTDLNDKVESSAKPVTGKRVNCGFTVLFMAMEDCRMVDGVVLDGILHAGPERPMDAMGAIASNRAPVVASAPSHDWDHTGSVSAATAVHRHCGHVGTVWFPGSFLAFGGGVDRGGAGVKFGGDGVKCGTAALGAPLASQY